MDVRKWYFKAIEFVHKGDKINMINSTTQWNLVSRLIDSWCLSIHASDNPFYNLQYQQGSITKAWFNTGTTSLIMSHCDIITCNICANQKRNTSKTNNTVNSTILLSIICMLNKCMVVSLLCVPNSKHAVDTTALLTHFKTVLIKIIVPY